MAPPDPIAGLVAYLKADAGVAATVGTAVYGTRLPAGVASGTTPPSAVVVAAAGGLGEGGDAPLMRPRVDVRCYGTTAAGAMAAWAAAFAALRALKRRSHASALLHAAVQEGGPLSLFDPDTDWPFVVSSWLVLVGEEPV